MKSKSLILCAITILTSVYIVHAQTPAAPGPYKFKKASDYASYEGKIKEYVAWLIKSPLDSNLDLHDQVEHFIDKWVNGAPNVTVTFGKNSEPALKNPGKMFAYTVMVTYMGGIAVYELNNPTEKDEAKIEKAGIEAILELYKHNPSLLNNLDGVRKYKQLQDSGELDKWIADNLAKDNGRK